MGIFVTWDGSYEVNVHFRKQKVTSSHFAICGNIVELRWIRARLQFLLCWKKSSRRHDRFIFFEEKLLHESICSREREIAMFFFLTSYQLYYLCSSFLCIVLTRFGQNDGIFPRRKRLNVECALIYTCTFYQYYKSHPF